MVLKMAIARGAFIPGAIPALEKHRKFPFLKIEDWILLNFCQESRCQRIADAFAKKPFVLSEVGKKVDVACLVQIGGAISNKF